MSSKDEIIDVLSYMLIIFGLCSLIVSYQVADMTGFAIGSLGIIMFLIGLKLQIIYSIKKWKDKEKKKK